jgi:asparagine synthetase B (glutamine-hydrolysing)
MAGVRIIFFVQYELSIIDLSTRSKQPMTSDDGELSFAFYRKISIESVM